MPAPSSTPPSPAAPLPPEAGAALTLFQRDDCHLCDHALGVLAQARAPDFDSVYIDDDATLEARYGARVPVLRDAAGRELDWPFDAAAVVGWLGAHGDAIDARGVAAPSP